MKVSNGNKVYLQVSDLTYLLEMVEDIPPSIRSRIKYGPINEYVEFSDIEDINFFKSLDWLIDFSEYKNIEYEELKKLYNDLYVIITDGNLDDYSKKKLTYKFKYIGDLIKYREGLYDFNFPLVPCANSFILETASCNPKYYITKAIDDNKLLLYKEGFACMSYVDNIPSSLISSALNLDKANRKSPSVSYGNTLVMQGFSDDFKFYVIESRFRLYEIVNNKDNKTGSSFVKRLKEKINKL